MIYEENEDMSFQLYQVESLVKGFVNKGDLERSINNLRGYLEKSMQGSVKTLDFTDTNGGKDGGE